MPLERSPQVCIFCEAAVLSTKSEETHTYNRQTSQLTNSKFSISCDCFLPSLLTQAIQKKIKKRGDPARGIGQEREKRQDFRIYEIQARLSF